MLPHHTAAHMKIPGLAGELLLPGSSEAQGIISGLQQEPLLSSFTLLLQAQQESISFLINFHLVSLQSSDTCLVSVTPLLPHQQGEFCTIVNRGLPAHCSIQQQLQVAPPCQLRVPHNCLLPIPFIFIGFADFSSECSAGFGNPPLFWLSPSNFPASRVACTAPIVKGALSCRNQSGGTKQ